jgi:hypothetical protein
VVPNGEILHHARRDLADISVKCLLPYLESSAPDGTAGAAMQQIADWLKKLGMSEYAQRFADNDIDASVLPELTDQDLKDLGVSLALINSPPSCARG